MNLRSYRSRDLIAPGCRVDELSVTAELRVMIECLLTALSSDVEIVDYLTGPLGLTQDVAWHAVRDIAGGGVATR